MTAKNKAKSNRVFLTAEGEFHANHNLRIWMMTSLFGLLVVIGLFNLYSATLGNQYFYTQFNRVFFGLFLFVLFGWFVPLRIINTYSFPILLLVIVSLVVVLVAGRNAGGATRWIHIGPLSVQPSEFAKLSIAMYVARFFYLNRQVARYDLRDLWQLILVLAIVFVLIFVQPDLGTAGVCVLIAMVQICFIRLNLLSVSIVSAFGVVLGGLGWFFFLHEYQKLRILNLFNPNLDPHGSGYNSIQSLVAIGSGRLFGKGFLSGTQTQLQFLPAHHTDFVFSVFAEELGFFAGILLFLLFGLISYLTLEIARHVNDTYSSLLAIGIGALIYIEFIINTAMVLGMFPVVGMPLPFFSFGGSSLITLCIAMGILVAIERKKIDSMRIKK